MKLTAFDINYPINKSVALSIIQQESKKRTYYLIGIIAATVLSEFGVTAYIYSHLFSVGSLLISIVLSLVVLGAGTITFYLLPRPHYVYVNLLLNKLDKKVTPTREEQNHDWMVFMNYFKVVTKLHQRHFTRAELKGMLQYINRLPNKK